MYTLKKLNYLFQDLEPYIDTHTMGLHYHKHMRGYLNKLNTLLVNNNYQFQYSIYDLYFYLDSFSYDDRENILFNLGGVLNHELYFESLSSNVVLPKGPLEERIIKQFGSYSLFVDKFKDIANSLKGSGYTFLEINLNGELVINNRNNQDSPLFHGNIPLFCIDLWEHAYYLNYENNRSVYLDNIFNVVSFSYANHVYEQFYKKYL